MLLDMHQALRCHAKSKRSGKPCRSPAVRRSSVCRMHGARGRSTERQQKRAEAWGLYGRDEGHQKGDHCARQTMAAIEG